MDQPSAPPQPGYSQPPPGYGYPPQQPPPYGPPGYPPVAAPPAPPPKKSKTALYVVVAVVVIAILLVGVLALAGTFSPASTTNNNNPGGTNPGTQPITVVSSGTVWQITVDHYEYVPCTTTAATSAMSGTFTATESITAYIFNPTEYQTFSSSGSASSYVWTSGSVDSGTVNLNLGAGTWYMVFDNTNIITTTSVQITSSVVATPT